MPKAKKPPVKKSLPDVPPITRSRAEAAASLGCDVQFVDGLISSGKLAASKIGRRVFIRVESIAAMLDASAM